MKKSLISTWLALASLFGSARNFLLFFLTAEILISTDSLSSRFLKMQSTSYSLAQSFHNYRLQLWIFYCEFDFFFLFICLSSYLHAPNFSLLSGTPQSLLFHCNIVNNYLSKNNSFLTHSLFSLPYNYHLLNCFLKWELIIKSTHASFPFSCIISLHQYFSLSLYAVIPFSSFSFHLVHLDVLNSSSFLKTDCKQCYKHWLFYADLRSYDNGLLSILYVKY